MTLLTLTIAAIFFGIGLVWRFKYLKYRLFSGKPGRNIAWGLVGSGVVFFLLATPLISTPYEFFLALAGVWLAGYSAYLLRQPSLKRAKRKKAMEEAGFKSKEALNDIESIADLRKAHAHNKRIKQSAKARYELQWWPGLIIGTAALAAFMLALFAMLRRLSLTTNQADYSPGVWWWLGALAGLGIIALIAMTLWKLSWQGWKKHLATATGIILAAVILGVGFHFTTQYLSNLANTLQVNPNEVQAQLDAEPGIEELTDPYKCDDAHMMGAPGGIPNEGTPVPEIFYISELALMFALQETGLDNDVSNAEALRQPGGGCLSVLGEEKYNLLIASEANLEAIKEDFFEQQNN